MHLSNIVLLALTPSLLATQPLVAAEPPGDEQIVLGMIEAINQRDLDALDQLVAPNVRRYSGATAGFVIENLDQFKAYLEQDFASVPDSVQTVNQIFAGDDRVAVHATYVGTQQGELGPFAPSGRRFEVPFIGIARIEDDKIAEIWVEWDNLNSLVQLGHFPPEPCDQAPVPGEGEEGPAAAADDGGPDSSAGGESTSGP